MAWTEDGAARNGARKYLIEAAIVFVAYYVAGKLGQATTEIRSSNLGPVWPAYGVALASVLRYGFRIWPALVTSAFLVAFQSPVPHIAAAGQAISATLAATTGGALLKWASFDRAISRLPDEQRAVLLLVTLEEMSYDSVARTLDIPIGTVMSRLSRAREKLRAMMLGQGATRLKVVK